MFRLYLSNGVYLQALKRGLLGGLEAYLTNDRQIAAQFSRGMAVARLHQLRGAGYSCWLVQA